MRWTSPSCLIIRGMRSSIIMLDFSTPLFQLALFSQDSFMIMHTHWHSSRATSQVYNMVIFVICSTTFVLSLMWPSGKNNVTSLITSVVVLALPSSSTFTIYRNALSVIVADKSMMIFCTTYPSFCLPLNIWPFCDAKCARPGHASIYLFGFWHALCHVYICVRRLVHCYKKGQTSLKHHVICCYDSECQASS